LLGANQLIEVLIGVEAALSEALTSFANRVGLQFAFSVLSAVQAY
jgi:hypothetical protein